MNRRVLIADDHIAIRQGVSRLLSEACSCNFDYASSHAEVLEQLRGGRWDLIILDLNMPGGNPFEFIASVKAAYPLTKLLVYTIERADQMGVRALKAGADGYLSKGESADQLVAAARRVLDGKRYLDDTLAEHLASIVAQPQARGGHEALSDREFQVLTMLAQGQSLTEVGERLNISVKTASTYRGRVLEKLTTADLVRYCIENKLV